MMKRNVVLDKKDGTIVACGIPFVKTSESPHNTELLQIDGYAIYVMMTENKTPLGVSAVHRNRHPEKVTSGVLIDTLIDELFDLVDELCIEKRKSETVSKEKMEKAVKLICNLEDMSYNEA